MAIYSIAVRTSVVTSANSVATMVTPSTTRATILEIGMTAVTAAATVIGIGHMVAGTTLGTTANGIPEDMAGPTSATQVGTTWTTQPTTPTSFFRRVSLPSQIGSGIIFTFPRGIIVPVSNNVGEWNVLGGATLDTWYVWDE